MALIRDRYELKLDVGNAIGNLNQFKTALAGLANFRAAGIAAIGTAIAALGTEMVQTARQMAELEQQLKLVTTGSGDLARIMSFLRDSAAATRTPFADIVNLYQRLSISTQDLGFTQQELIKITENFSKALKISGADAATTAAVIRQFSQAMGSGVVRGDELVSIIEGMGPALNIMAQETGLTIAEIRRLAADGQLTAEVMAEMFLNSQAITDAFGQMAPTATQMEQAVGEAFNRLIAASAEYIDNLTGISDAYKAILDTAASTFNQIGVFIEEANFANALAAEDINLSNLDEIVTKYNDIADVLGEVERRYQETRNDLADTSIVELIFGEDEGLEQRAQELFQIMEELQRRIAEDYTARLDAREIEMALEPYQALIERLDQYTAANDESTASLTAARTALRQAAEDIATLESLVGTYEGELINVNSALQEARERHADLTEEVLKLGSAAGELTFDEYLTGIIINARDAAGELDFASQAQERLNEMLADGTLTAIEYNIAMENVTSVINRFNREQREAEAERQRSLEETRRAIEDSENFIQQLNQGIEDSRFELEALNMNPLERQIAEISRDINRDLETQIRQLQSVMNDTNAAEIQGQIAVLQQNAQSAIATQTQLATQSYEHQRTFSYGWRTAFEEYAENATNAAETAREVFTNAAKGMEDAIVNFAKTGKFEFKSFIASILEDLLRAQVRRTLANVFSLPLFGGGGSSGGSLFGGFFATGGMIPPGRFGVVGENGPELVNGPANVTPLTSGNVTYNINAVDALSFKQLVAQDPGFIHAVATQGSKAIPTRR